MANQQLRTSVTDVHSGLSEIPLRESNSPSNEEENALLEFVVFIKENFFSNGKFKMNWWALVLNPSIAKVLGKAMPAIIKAIGKWIGL